MRTPAWVLALWLLFPAAVGAQRVELQGEVQHPAVQALRAILDRGTYRLIGRDTVLSATSSIAGDLVVSGGADVRLEGTVTGSIAVLDGTLFLRPGSRVGGQIVSTPNALVLPSTLGTFGDTLAIPAEIATRVERSAEGVTVRVTPPPAPPKVVPGGLFGLGLPSYNRVDGLTLRLSAVAQPLGDDERDPYAEASVAYHTARGDFGGRVQIAAPFGGDGLATAAVGRATVTNEAWIRGDLPNSLAAIALASDARNYHESDFVTATLAQQAPQSLETGRGFVAPRLTLLLSRDRSLEARDPWALFGGDWRPNPPVAEGTLASAALGTLLGWRGRTTRFAGDLALEWAPGGVGDFEFAQVVGDGQWSMLALRGHSITLRSHLLLALSGAAPPQRWSFVGGTNTLPTLELGSLRGDNLVFIESTYLAPVPRVSVPVLGAPSAALRHAVGSAWVTGGPEPRWEQNLGAGLLFPLVELFVFLNPAAAEARPEISVSLSLPF